MKAKKLTKETILDIDVVDRGFPKFTYGDTIRVSQRIKEGAKERIQEFEGDVIKIKSRGIATTFTVRKIAANNIPVERIFPYYSDIIESITFLREGDVRRAKLYYLRDRTGKKAHIREKVRKKDEKAAQK